nr:MAG TPA: hypothetical protein [Caudoviricetes sp.]
MRVFYSLFSQRLYCLNIERHYKRYNTMLKEIQGLKCPNHDLIRDNYYFRYQEAYPGARPLNSTHCMRCGYTMSLHKVGR